MDIGHVDSGQICPLTEKITYPRRHGRYVPHITPYSRKSPLDMDIWTYCAHWTKVENTVEKYAFEKVFNPTLARLESEIQKIS